MSWVSGAGVMVEATNDFIVEMLRRIQADIGDLKADNREIKTCLGSLETQIAHLHVQVAEISVRMDRRDDTMERIMRRLELTEQPH
jgi:predicted  nucleic acid-binding Zn-ribbon protein